METGEWSQIFLCIRAKGGVTMGKKKKETRIREELARLAEIYKVLPSNTLAIVRPLLENAAFMKVTLEDLQETINANGCSDDYQNGANQFGKKASADLQAYNSLIKNYNTISDRLEKLLPPEQRKSRLRAMMDE